MVHEKSKHLLAEVYRGRLDGDLGDTAAFSDVYTMKRMSKEHPGKAAAATGPFEFVAEKNMDSAMSMGAKVRYMVRALVARIHLDRCLVTVRGAGAHRESQHGH
jgi:hypothetical protein